MESIISEHTIRRFDEELDKLRSRMIKMGSLTQEQVSLSLKSLKDRNCELAKAVYDNDEKINLLDLKIDKQCMRIFALHQPVATDLRLVMSALNINDDLELIGDAAANIASDVVELCQEPDVYEKTKLPELAELTEDIVVKVIDSIIYNDVELAKEVVKKEPVIETVWKDSLDFLAEAIKQNPSIARAGAYLIDVSRNMQLIADLSMSVAQEMMFLVEAKLAKHKSYDELIKEEEEPKK